MTVVLGTAGHIDHGKTSLLRALTGIDADRLPDEQRRGMTIDVGYAHLVLPNGRLLDFVDVPGHNRLVGNMLVGAGEIDAALLVVAADDGPRAQTVEHLALLDAVGVHDALAVITKADLVSAERLAEVRLALQRLVGATSLAGAPLLAVSASTGAGLGDLVAALAELEGRLAGRDRGGGGTPRLAIDRVFTIRGRGTVVTGSLRGAGLAAGAAVRIEPGGAAARIREVQVHGARVAGRAPPGRTALNLSGVDAAAVRRGQVVTSGPGVEVSDRLLVAIRPPAALDRPTGASWPPAAGQRVRLHLGTEQAEARIGRARRAAVEVGAGTLTAVVRLDAPVAAAVGDRLVLRRTSPAEVVAGGVVLDPVPPAGPARRRVSAIRLAVLHASVAERDGPAVVRAMTELHGALPAERVQAVLGAVGPVEAAGSPGIAGSAPGIAGSAQLAADLAADLEDAAQSIVAGRQARSPLDPGAPTGELRHELAIRLRRATGTAERVALAAAARTLDQLVADGRLIRDGDRVRDPSSGPGLPAELLAAMDRLERRLSTPAPPPLAQAAREVGCPPDGVRALEAAGRIVRLEADLAWATAAYRRLADMAVAMARRGPLSPAAFRDATGTSRRYVLAILEDLDRRGILQRGPDGHRPGPRAPAAAASPSPTP